MPDPAERPIDVVPWADTFARSPQTRERGEHESTTERPPVASGASPTPPLHFVMPGLDPMKPGDILVPGPVQHAPPRCPVPGCSMLLYPVANDPQSGNLLLECLVDPTPRHPAYQAVYRVADGSYGPRPGTEVKHWSSPAHSSSPPPAVQPPVTLPAIEGFVIIKKKPQRLDGVIGVWEPVPGTRASVFICSYCASVVPESPHTCAPLQTAYDDMVRTQRNMTAASARAAKTAARVQKMLKKGTRR